MNEATAIPYITVAWLRERDACEEQVELFSRVWPDGAMITRAALLHAAEKGLSVSWLALRILPVPLWAEYERQRVPLWEEYKRQRAWRQHAPLWAEYERQVAPLLADTLELP